jgi:hypothetical protein
VGKIRPRESGSGGEEVNCRTLSHFYLKVQVDGLTDTPARLTLRPGSALRSCGSGCTEAEGAPCRAGRGPVADAGAAPSQPGRLHGMGPPYPIVSQD